ncbi:Glycosyltransferase involved in cell wall bisynthesis [Enterococcus casseliflavus]|uniref:glycosyltransferase n=1 Tax=Enterococcus casseliflavus TaxID=37734 RepID=UPI0008F1D385|nr:glycosyltransferase [Enterococcus casseliflavus]SFD37331.1 Glycosyltransferase involved in cell wall bisynthesis [Enterococcus casseliflavus]
MNVLIIVDHYPLSPRVLKIRNSMLKNKNVENVKVFAWNRNNTRVTENFVVTYNQEIGYGNFYKSLINIRKFLREVENYIKIYKPDKLHLIDYSVLPLSKLSKKKIDVIYEVYDIKFYKNFIYNLFREISERKFLTNVGNIVIASPFFEQYYREKLKFNRNIVCLNNKPSKNFLNKADNQVESLINSPKIFIEKIVISFIGTIRYKEILFNLIDVIKEKENFILLLAGDGPDSELLHEYVETNSLKSKVIFTGRFNTCHLSEIYRNTDFVWAAYPNDDMNVKYAISNKFFESMVFSKPIIVSEDTFLADMVKERELGFCINPYDKQSISSVLNKIDKKNFHFEFQKIDKLFWEDEENKLSTIYC